MEESGESLALIPYEGDDEAQLVWRDITEEARRRVVANPSAGRLLPTPECLDENSSIQDHIRFYISTHIDSLADDLYRDLSGRGSSKIDFDEFARVVMNNYVLPEVGKSFSLKIPCGHRKNRADSPASLDIFMHGVLEEMLVDLCKESYFPQILVLCKEYTCKDSRDKSKIVNRFLLKKHSSEEYWDVLEELGFEFEKDDTDPSLLLILRRLNHFIRFLSSANTSKVDSIFANAGFYIYKVVDNGKHSASVQIKDASDCRAALRSLIDSFSSQDELQCPFLPNLGDLPKLRQQLDFGAATMTGETGEMVQAIIKMTKFTDDLYRAGLMYFEKGVDDYQRAQGRLLLEISHLYAERLARYTVDAEIELEIGKIRADKILKDLLVLEGLRKGETIPKLVKEIQAIEGAVKEVVDLEKTNS